MKCMKFMTHLSCLLLLSVGLSAHAGIDVNEGFGFKIVIDPAMQKDSPGVYSITGQPEYKLNYIFASDLQKVFNKFGFEVIITRTPEQNVSVEERAAMTEGANILISLRHDSVVDKYCSFNSKGHCVSDYARGFSVFVADSNVDKDLSLDLAENIGRNLMLEGFFATKHHAEKIPGEGKELVNETIGLYMDDSIELLKLSKVPAVQVNLGVVANKLDVKVLQDKKQRAKIIQNIVDAVRRYKDEL